MSFTMRKHLRTLILKESTSMTIYSSDKAVPYVYICTHKETNQFYIGYRMANVELNIPSHLDLPEYKTSSTTVRPAWSNYTWTIVAEFFDPSHAYAFEQQMICDNWDNPLLLNSYYRLGEHKQFRNRGGKPSGRKGKPSGKKGIPNGPQQNPSSKPAWNKDKPSPLKGIPSGKKGKPNGRKGKPSPLKGIPSGKKGIPNGPQQNPSSKPAWNKGKPTGRKGIPSGRKGKPSPLKGIPSPLKGKPSPLKGIPSGKQREVECPHCGLVGGTSAMKRHHFDNCKMKPVINSIILPRKLLCQYYHAPSHPM